jgi:hypothetical protein
MDSITSGQRSSFGGELPCQTQFGTSDIRSRRSLWLALRTPRGEFAVYARRIYVPSEQPHRQVDVLAMLPQAGTRKIFSTYPRERLHGVKQLSARRTGSSIYHKIRCMRQQLRVTRPSTIQKQLCQ